MSYNLSDNNNDNNPGLLRNGLEFILRFQRRERGNSLYSN